MAEVGLLKFRAEDRSDVDEMLMGTSAWTENAGIERIKPEFVSTAKRNEKS